MKIAIAIVLVSIILVSSAFIFRPVDIKIDDHTPTQKILSDIEVGMKKSDVEGYLKLHSIVYSWSKRQNSFHVTFKNISGGTYNKKSIIVNISLNDNDKVHLIEGHEVFTSL